jgi:hypothetical protein
MIRGDQWKFHTGGFHQGSWDPFLVIRRQNKTISFKFSAYLSRFIRLCNINLYKGI